MDIAKTIYAGAGNDVTGELPTSRRMFSTLKAFRAPIFTTFRRFLAHAKPRPGSAIYPSLSNELQVAIGRLLTGSSTPVEALDTAGTRVEQDYKLLGGGT
jgi:multiple sugar transport system substrate-binding protein